MADLQWSPIQSNYQMIARPEQVQLQDTIGLGILQPVQQAVNRAQEYAQQQQQQAQLPTQSLPNGVQITPLPIEPEITPTAMPANMVGNAPPIVPVQNKPSIAPVNNKPAINPKFQYNVAGYNKYRDMIVREAKANGIDPVAALAIASIESQFNAGIKNPTSSYAGLFQINSNDHAQWANPEYNTRYAMQLAKQNKRYLEKHGIEWNAGTMYFAHQQGMGGAKALWKNPEMKAVDALMTLDYYRKHKKGYAYGLQLAKDAITKNGGNLNMLAKDFTKKWVDKATNAYNGFSKVYNPQQSNNQPAPIELNVKNPNPDTLVFGDSLAVGTAQQNKLRSAYSRVGANTKELYEQAQKLGDLTGKTILYSSGLSNSYGLSMEANAKYIRDTINLFKSKGANVQLGGVSNSYNDRTKWKKHKYGNYNGKMMNQSLEDIAKELGIDFVGGFESTSDGIHGTIPFRINKGK